ncbi:MAG: tRNA (adenosine(37)-N6)-dimethylallyltransferase MiaA [Rikenellaceae bacterium]
MFNQKDKGRPRLIVVVGATASGKSALSMELARHFGCPIISTDSRQFYQGIPIGTAQPSAADLAEVEHHFIGCRTLADDYNAGAYEADAVERLGELFEHHSTVVAVGGSGLYIKALCEGLDDLPKVPIEVRDAVRWEYQQSGIEPLLEELQQCDPPYYECVDRANSARVMRAVEICRASGCRYSDLRSGEAQEREFEVVKVGLDLPREELYDRINRRVDAMLREGLEEEVRAVYPLRDLNSLQTVGYRELFSCFDGECSFDEAVELIKRNSRRYAKRQMTWFRRDHSIQWFYSYDPAAVLEFVGGVSVSVECE